MATLEEIKEYAELAKIKASLEKLLKDEKSLIHYSKIIRNYLE